MVWLVNKHSRAGIEAFAKQVASGEAGGDEFNSFEVLKVMRLGGVEAVLLHVI